MTTNVAANLYNQLFTCQNDNTRHGELKYPVISFQDSELELSTVRKAGQVASSGSIGRIRKLSLSNRPDSLPLEELNGRDIEGLADESKINIPGMLSWAGKRTYLF